MRAGHPAVVPGEPVVDTIKSVDAAGLVTGTPERQSLRAVQTPQGFDRATLGRGPMPHGSLATDDAALVERLGLPVLVVDGHPDAFKVTTPADLQRAERLVADRPPRRADGGRVIPARIGYHIDRRGRMAPMSPVAVVTGGGSGIGAATARRLAQRGL